MMQTIPKTIISKAAFLHRLQCEKKLYLFANQTSLNITPDPLSPQSAHLTRMGQKVGIIAQQLFPDGTTCTSPTTRESLHRTKQCIEDKRSTLYEAAVATDKMYCDIDILHRTSSGQYAIYEIKSSTELKEEYMFDAAFQYCACLQAGIEVSDVYVVYINKSYVRQDTLDLKQLFRVANITAFAKNSLPIISDHIDAGIKTISSPVVPKISIGPHCSEPHECMFSTHCQAEINLPSYSVLDLVRGGTKRWKLLEMNIKRIEDIPTPTRLSESQRVQVFSERTQQPFILVAEVLKFLEKIQYPVYFLDFESVMSPIPLYENTFPYQPICTQYSLHTLQADGSLHHSDYLAPTSPNSPDPRADLLAQLVADAGSKGSILVYSAAFEVRRLYEMGEAFPEQNAAVANVISRIVDLAVPFRKKHVYYPAMQGKYSLKKVLPALVPDLNYCGLRIGDGASASAVFLDLIEGNYTGNATQARRDLLEYCKLDTYGMVKILEKLREIAH